MKIENKLFSKKAIESITRFYSEDEYNRHYASDDPSWMYNRVSYNTPDDAKREAKEELAKYAGIAGGTALAGLGLYELLSD